MIDKLKKVIALMGPTAVGKTGVAIELAKEFGGEIIGADSMQIYRHIIIGVAAPSADEIAAAPHHLVGIIDPAAAFSVAEWLERALRIIDDVIDRGKIPIVAGGTGLYFRALFDGLFKAPEPDPEIRNKLKERALHEDLYEELKSVDPDAARNIHPNDKYRTLRALEVFYQTGIPLTHHWKNQTPPCGIETLRIGLDLDRAELHRRIDERANRMIENGLVEEVNRLKAMGYPRDLWPMRHFGYKYIWAHTEGEIELKEAIDLLARDTRRYARRQLTWFRAVSKIKWYNPDYDIVEIKKAVRAYIYNA